MWKTVITFTQNNHETIQSHQVTNNLIQYPTELNVETLWPSSHVHRRFLQDFIVSPYLPTEDGRHQMFFTDFVLLLLFFFLTSFVVKKKLTRFHRLNSTCL